MYDFAEFTEIILIKKNTLYKLFHKCVIVVSMCFLYS